MHGTVGDREMRLLRVFVTIVESGGFTPACAQLNIAESTISTHMNVLEQRLGLRLCERGRGGFSVTSAGQSVYDQAKRLLQNVDDFRTSVGLLSRELSGTIRLGVPDASATHPTGLVPRALRALSRHHPDVHIELETGSPRQLEQLVLDGRLHAAVSSEHMRVAGLSYERLASETNWLYCGLGHPLFDLPDEQIGSAELARAGCISRGYHARFDRDLLGDVPHSATASSIEATAHLILSGSYVGFLPAHFAQAWIETGEMRALKSDALRYEVHFALLFLTSRAKDPAVQTLLRDLRAAAGATFPEMSRQPSLNDCVR